MKLIQAKLVGQMTERKKQRVESILKQVGLDLFQVDQNEIQAEDSQTTLGTSFAFPVKDDQADRISSEFRAVGFVVSRIEWLDALTSRGTVLALETTAAISFRSGLGPICYGCQVGGPAKFLCRP
jgi:hypothetical protein